ncbi:MAG: alanine racemase [Alcanivorax sp.]
MCAMSGELVIDLAAIRDNYAIIKNKVGAGCLVAPSVKADAYGLGAKNVVSALYEAGARDFFVATLDEGAELRALKPDINIYILNGYQPDAHDFYKKNSLTPVLNSLTEIRSYAQKGGAAILHFDTGMNRLGIPADEAAELFNDMSILSGIDVKCVMSHLISSEESQNPSNVAQLTKFKEITAHFPDVPHSLCNSGGVFLPSDFHHDIVRPGIALYGGKPTDGQDENPMNQPVSLNVPVLQIHAVKAEESAGYNATHRFHKNGIVAVMSIGYADGVFRKISNVGALYFQGQKMPICGRVSMDLIICDISDIPAKNQPKVGDMVEVIGTHQTIDDLARDSETISYEILTALGHRFKRTYKG